MKLRDLFFGGRSEGRSGRVGSVSSGSENQQESHPTVRILNSGRFGKADSDQALLGLKGGR